MDVFTKQYIETMLWAESFPGTGEPLDGKFSIKDLAPESLAKIEADCAKFQAKNADDLATRDDTDGGHDFWLTRNDHGSGFWDGDWDKEVGERLTKASEKFGNCTIYPGDDDLLYLSP